LVELEGGKSNLEAMPLDFVQLAKSHTGVYLADTIRTVVEKFGIQDKVSHSHFNGPPSFSPPQ
jgi:hypothetical protein